MQIQETMNTASKASNRKNPLFDKHISVTEVESKTMIAEFDGSGQIDMSHRVEIDALFIWTVLFFFYGFRLRKHIIIKKVIMFEIQIDSGP